MLAEVGHFIDDNLFVTVERSYNRIIILVHNMHIDVFLQILSSLRFRTHRTILSFCMKHRFLMSIYVVPAAQKLLVLVLCLKCKFMFTFILFGVLCNMKVLRSIGFSAGPVAGYARQRITLNIHGDVGVEWILAVSLRSFAIGGDQFSFVFFL